jgi:hypothetical protein
MDDSTRKLALVAGLGIPALCLAAYVNHLRKTQKRSEDEHERIAAAALNVMVQASAKHAPVPPLVNVNQILPSPGWIRCMEALAGVDSKLDQSQNAADVGANDQVLVSACNTTMLSASRGKQHVDSLLAMHAKRNFPDLPAMMASDPTLVLLLLDAPNILTTAALAKVFPDLDPGRVCIPQADPAHYSRMVTEGRMLFNVRFQRLDTWLTANADGGVRVPIFFADYETSVYGRRSMQLSPLQDLQRFIRYRYAASSSSSAGGEACCLVGVTLSYRELHKLHYPAVLRRIKDARGEKTLRPIRLGRAIQQATEFLRWVGWGWEKSCVYAP